MKYILSLLVVFFTSFSFGFIPDHSIAKIKIGPWEGVKSTSSGSFATASLTSVDVTNLSVVLKTYGRPVKLQLINNGGAAGAVSISGSSSTTDTGLIYFLANTIAVSTNGVTAGLGTSQVAVPCSSFSAIVEPIAGTHTFKVQAQTSATTNFQIIQCSLMAYEL